MRHLEKGLSMIPANANIPEEPEGPNPLLSHIIERLFEKSPWLHERCPFANRHH
jgi:hypothetical protein